MKLTIIVDDNAVYVDGLMKAWAPNPLDLGTCGIPSDVHALQWNNGSGWIEFKDPVPNQDITSLPEWANACVEAWNQWTPYVPPPTPPVDPTIPVTEI